jgi:hypothetical protein
MRPTIALLLALGLLAGCSVKYDLSGSDWRKPDTGIEIVTLGEIECVRSAREAGSTPDLIVGGLADVARYVLEERQRSSAYRGCMRAKGYQPA